MTVTLRKTSSRRAERKWHKDLFESAFPPEERPPFFVLRLRARRCTDWWVIQSGGQNAGFFYVIRDERLAYLFFFAVDEQFRGQGIGSEALRQLLSLYQRQTFFLAVEPPDETADNYAMRIRRIGFYRRNGLHPLDQWVREGDVVYSLLGVGNRIESEDYHRLINAWRSSFPLFSVTMEIGEGEARDRLADSR